MEFAQQVTITTKQQTNALQMWGRKRSLFCVIALVLYTASINVYVIKISDPNIPLRYMKLWYNYTTASMVVFFILDEICEYFDQMHKQLNMICKFSVIINYILIIFTHQLIIQNTFYMLLLFNGSIFAVSLMILLACIKHGYFKNTVNE